MIPCIVWLRVGQCFRYVRMVDAGIERTEVEHFLKTAITKVGELKGELNLTIDIDHSTQVTSGIGGSPGLATQHIGKVSSRLVESVNAELSQVGKLISSMALRFHLNIFILFLMYIIYVLFRLAPLLMASNL